MTIAAVTTARCMRERARFVALAAAGLATSCHPAGDVSAPTHGRTLEFVVRDLAVDDAAKPTGSGFDLDGRVSREADPDGCGFTDRISETDPDQNVGNCASGTPGCRGGVDNQLPALLDAVDRSENVLSRVLLGEAQLRGDLILIVRVLGVDRTDNDPSVRVMVYRGFSLDRDCSNLFSGRGRFAVSADSLADPSDIDTSRFVADGEIVDSRLRVRFGTNSGVAPEDPVTLGGGSSAVPELQLFQMRLRVTLDRAGHNGTFGNMGAWAPESSMSAALARAAPTSRTALQLQLGQLTDLRCIPSEPDGAIAVGARFALARAKIERAALGAAPVGTCGSPQ